MQISERLCDVIFNLISAGAWLGWQRNQSLENKSALLIDVWRRGDVSHIKLAKIAR